MMTVICIAVIALLGMVAGIAFTMKLVLNAINRADICYEEKQFVRGVLGIPQGDAK